MKSKTTPTLKLTQLPNGGVEIVQNFFEHASPTTIGSRVFTLDEREVKALKDFLNEPAPTSK